MKSKKEILAFVIGSIVLDGRCVVGGICQLENEKGARCGFSLCMTDEARDKYKGSNFVVAHQQPEEVERCLKKEFHGHDYEFWVGVQHLHDDNGAWVVLSNETRLSPHGRDKVNKLLTL